MKNGMRRYIAAWAVAVAVFNIVALLISNTVFKYKTENFWVVYIAIMLGFIVQAGCSVYYMRQEKKEERFLALPVAIIGYITLLMFLLLGLEAITLQFLPSWFTRMIAVLVMAYYILAVIKTVAAAEIISETQARVERQTSCIYTLTAQAKALEQAALPELRQLSHKVYESFRYSDPVSTEATIELEENIQMEYNKFSVMVKNANQEEAAVIAEKISQMVSERNEICKRSKR